MTDVPPPPSIPADVFKDTVDELDRRHERLLLSAVARGVATDPGEFVAEAEALLGQSGIPADVASREAPLVAHALVDRNQRSSPESRAVAASAIRRVYDTLASINLPDDRPDLFDLTTPSLN